MDVNITLRYIIQSISEIGYRVSDTKFCIRYFSKVILLWDTS